MDELRCVERRPLKRYYNLGGMRLFYLLSVVGGILRMKSVTNIAVLLIRNFT